MRESKRNPLGKIIAKTKQSIGHLKMELEALTPYDDYDEVYEEVLSVEEELNFKQEFLKNLIKEKKSL